MPTLRLPKPYTRAEIQALHAAADRPEVRATMTFLRETGLRSAEALSIPTEEAEGWPRPGRILNRHPRASLRVVGKGDKERRVVLTRDALRAAEILLEHGRNSHLLPWSGRGLRYVLAELGKRAGVHCHPHRFRHCWVTELVEAGNPIEVVADMAGHEKTETTRLYFLLSERIKVEAMRRRRRWLRRR